MKVKPGMIKTWSCHANAEGMVAWEIWGWVVFLLSPGSKDTELTLSFIPTSFVHQKSLLEKLQKHHVFVLLANSKVQETNNFPHAAEM